MLNFINKEGKKVMEMNDDGEVKVLHEKLKKSFSKETPEKEKEND